MIEAYKRYNMEIVGVIAIFLVSSAIFTWFRGNLINMVDFDFPITSGLDFQKLSYVWTENNLSLYGMVIGRFILQIPQTILYYMGFNIVTIEKLLLWFLIFSVVLYFIYQILVDLLIKRKNLALIYMTNRSNLIGVRP